MVISFRDAASDAVVSSLCAALAVSDNVHRLFEWGLDPEGRSNVAKGVRRLLCNIDPEDDTPAADPPFTGGQCDNTIYQYVIQVPTESGLGQINANAKMRGPITGWRVQKTATGIQGFVTGRSNSTPQSCQVSAGPLGELMERMVFNVSSNQTFLTSQASFSFLGICGGGPDDCGDPDPVYPDPEPVVGPTTNITYNIDESTQITVPLTAVFAPIFVKATGQFSFPIRVDIGGVTFSGTLDVSPTINLNIYPDGSGGGNGGGTDEPSDDIPPIGIPDEDETPEFDNRIIGVFIRSNINPNIVRATGIPAGENLPEIWAPRLANCKFLIRAGETTGWTEDIDVKNASQYIPCPHPGGAVDVRVFPQQGVTVAVEPHRAVPLLPELPPVEE